MQSAPKTTQTSSRWSRIFAPVRRAFWPIAFLLIGLGLLVTTVFDIRSGETLKLTRDNYERRERRYHRSTEPVAFWLSISGRTAFGAFALAAGIQQCAGLIAPLSWRFTRQGRADRTYYESLGPDDPSRRCRGERCHRPALQNSHLCRRHQFEMEFGRKCRFTD